MERIGYTFMTEREVALYKYMIEVQTSSLGALFMRLNEYYGRMEENSDLVNSAAYRKLRRDVESINKSNAQFAILPVKHKGKVYGYKLADSNEAILERADNFHNRAMRWLVREQKLREKVANNNQFRFTSDDSIRAIKSER